MDTQFRCQNERRRQRAQELKTLNGIDYLEVASYDQKTLKVYFLFNLPGEINAVPPAATPLTQDNILIEGGVRVQNISVGPISVSKNVLTVTVDQAGDYSTYTLRLVTSPTQPDPPPAFDTQLSAVDFSFKVACPSDFDCEQTTVCPPPVLTEPDINYLAKDYSSFRRLMLDRLSVLMPDWQESSPADVGIAIIELMAYVGDHLSYYQDAVATEAYLGTARRRISLRRHARLLDYFVHDGCNARTWASIEVASASPADGKSLPSGTLLLTQGSDPKVAVATADLEKALAEQPAVFETMHNLTLNSAHNSISFYTWSDHDCCLPQGSTRASLLNDPPLSLNPGDVLIFEEILGPITGVAADADPTHRQAVRLKTVTQRTDELEGKSVVDIEWYPQDALTFPLCLTAQPPSAGGQELPVSIARGNVVLADHGRTYSQEQLDPPEAPDTGNYRPRLRLTGITCQVAYDDASARLQPVAGLLDQDPRKALPVVSLNDGSEDWTVQRDLLDSDRFATDFVVETERDGTAQLRFGDDLTAGKKPAGGTTIVATYRVGNGATGNLGTESLRRIVTDLAGIQRVRNPIPASGGTDPETMEEVRQYAPQAFRTQQRAVTEADWAEVAARHDQVQKAAARFRWTGSWYTVFITIDRKGGLPVTGDESFLQDIQEFLEQFRIAGYDLQINDPVHVPLDILLNVCVQPGYFRSDVEEALLKVFSRNDFSDGTRGFFHPDNFTFGQPVYLSRIYQAAMQVVGVASVDAVRFQRWGKLADHELEDGAIVPSSLEIIELDNDPNFPENGKIAFDVQGGL